MSLWHNRSMALPGHVCPQATFQPSKSFSSAVSLGSSSDVSDQTTPVKRFVATLQAERPTVPLKSINSSGCTSQHGLVCLQWNKSLQLGSGPPLWGGGEHQLFGDFPKLVQIKKLPSWVLQWWVVLLREPGSAKSTHFTFRSRVSFARVALA